MNVDWLEDEDKPAKTILVGLLIFLLALGTFLAIKLLHYQRQSKIARTRMVLFTYAMASTNHFSFLKRWPQTIHELSSDTNTGRFVASGSRAMDAWGHNIEYDPFNETRGYGVVRSTSGIAVRFTPTNICEQP